MAVLLDFEMVREDERVVEYRFGYPELDRQLVIEKESLEGWAPEPELDSNLRRVYGEILRMLQEDGAWPVGGMYAA